MGDYKFYFAIDKIMNFELTLDQLYGGINEARSFPKETANNL